jgi:hypothetical protein
VQYLVGGVQKVATREYENRAHAEHALRMCRAHVNCSEEKLVRRVVVEHVGPWVEVLDA